jgi:hypothetical protein
LWSLVLIDNENGYDVDDDDDDDNNDNNFEE